MRRAFFVFLFVGICAEAGAIEVPATCPPKPVDEESAIALANTWFKKGQKYVEDKEYKAAVEAFSCSHSIIEHQNTLYNAFKSAILATMHDAAIELGNMTLALSTDEKTKDDVRRLLASIQPVPIEPDEAGKPEAAAPEAVIKHPPDKVATPPVAMRKRGRSTLWKSGMVTTLLGGAGLVAGGVLQSLAASAQKTTAQTHDYGQYVEAKREVDTFQKGAIASFIAGGVFLGAGIALFLVDAKSEEKSNLAMVLSGNGLLLRGTF